MTFGNCSFAIFLSAKMTSLDTSARHTFQKAYTVLQIIRNYYKTTLLDMKIGVKVQIVQLVLLLGSKDFRAALNRVI